MRPARPQSTLWRTTVGAVGGRRAAPLVRVGGAAGVDEHRGGAARVVQHQLGGAELAQRLAEAVDEAGREQLGEGVRRLARDGERGEAGGVDGVARHAPRRRPVGLHVVRQRQLGGGASPAGGAGASLRVVGDGQPAGEEVREQVGADGEHRGQEAVEGLLHRTAGGQLHRPLVHTATTHRPQGAHTPCIGNPSQEVTSHTRRNHAVVQKPSKISFLSEV